MSRHRNVRSMKYEDEYDEYDVYGHSVEDDYCVSPGTAAQFMYDRNQEQKLNSFFKEQIPEEDEGEEDNGTSSLADSSSSLKPQLSEIEQAKLNSCLEEMRNILGDTTPEHVMVEAVRKADFKYEVAINSVLNTQEVPKQQREPRQKRQRGRRDDSDTKKNDFPASDQQTTVKVTKSEESAAATASPSVARMTFSTNPSQKVTGFMIGEDEESSNGSTDTALPTSKLSHGNSKSPNEENNPMVVTEVDGNNGGSIRNLGEGAVGGSGLSVPSTPQRGSPSDDESTVVSAATPILPPIHKSASKVKLERLNMQQEYERRKADAKDNINLVVIGHVDAGKSTLMGHVLYQLGFVNKRTMHKYEQESKKMGKASFAYAWVLDETEEERSRGVTMDVAQTRFETKTKVVTLLDAPGHKDFIPNMITGAAQADVALLVVNASTGEFETGFEAGGQTREHAMLIRSLGVSQLTVAVNKMDTVEWDAGRFETISRKLCQFLRQTGFRESDLVVIPCSGLLGENLAVPPTEPKLTAWYNGPTVVDQIDQLRPPDRPVDKPLRLCVTDVFKGMGSGFTVTGTMQAGSIQAGDRILVMPQGEMAQVKNVTIDDLPVRYAFSGDNAAVTLLGIEMNNIGIGSILCDPADPIRSTCRFKARVVIFNIEVPITKGFPCVLHYQSLTEPANFRKLVSQLHKSTGEVVKKRPRCLVKNTNALVEIEVGRNICIEHYKDYKDLGRFMLRAGGTTIAAGLVTEIVDAKSAKADG